MAQCGGVRGWPCQSSNLRAVGVPCVCCPRRRAVVQLKELFSEGALPMGLIGTLAELTGARVGDKSSMVASEAVTLLKELAMFAWAVLDGAYKTMAGGASGGAADGGGGAAVKSMGLDAAQLLATIEKYEAQVKVSVATASLSKGGAS